MKLVLSLAQMRVAASDPDANLAKAEGILTEARARGSQLVCFPEMWTTGFDWAWIEGNRQRHEALAEEVAALARRHGLWLCGSMPLPNAEGRTANTAVLFDEKGERRALYRKTHLFSFVGEDRHLAPGEALTLAQTPWGPVGLAVCYDIRFPELFRVYGLRGARLVLVPTAFPYPRLEHWKVLVRARAIENQVFVAGVNQVGSEGPEAQGNVVYFGTSTVVGPWGEVLAEGGEADEALLTVELDLDAVEAARAKMRVFQDRRPDLYGLKGE